MTQENKKKILIKRLIKVAKIIDPYTLVINQGKQNRIEIGDKFQVYSTGEEIYDPDTKKGLGRLEIIRGTGRITHIQEKMSILTSDMKTESKRTLKTMRPSGSVATSLLNWGREEVEEQLPAKMVPFQNPEFGDIVRRV